MCLKVKLAFLLTLSCLHLTSASYFGLPRIHFNGIFRADVSTGNNYAENYLIAKYSDEFAYPSWNPDGTGEFAFVNCFVTAVVYANGTRATTSKEDPLIGQPIVNNPAMVPPKLVDLDSPDYDLSSTLYGMRFGINWSPNIKKSNSFIGEWEPATLARDIWGRQINDTTADRYTQTIATQGSSKLVNVKWGNLESEALKQLYKGYNKTELLSVSVSLFNYTRPYQEDLFLYGVVAGTIGVGASDESLNFVGERVLRQYNKARPPIDIPKDNPCADADAWMFTAYFSVSDQKNVTVDFGNSIKIDFSGRVCDFGPLYLAMFVSCIACSNSTSTEKVEVIDEIPYRSSKWYNETAGVNDFLLTNPQFRVSNNYPFAVVRFKDMHGKPDGSYPVCKDSQTSSPDSRHPAYNDNQTSSPCAYVILKESRFHLRPMDHHVLRLEAGQNITVRLRLREYGMQPELNTQVRLKDMSPNRPSENFLTFTNPVITDKDGTATFNVTAKEIGRPRGKLEMDGEVFVFGYCVEPEKKGYTEVGLCEETYTNRISFLAWGKTTYDKPVFWDDHVKPIFLQYERLYPAMNRILRLGQYEDVVKPHNIQLLIKAMNLSINHPSYMPVTRDLSPSRIEMILEWLQSEHHYRNWSHVEETLYTPPQFCQEKNYEDKATKPPIELEFSMKGDEEDEQEDPRLMSLRGDDLLADKFVTLAAPMSDSEKDIPEWRKDMDKTCSVEILKRNLQDAVTLEFATIPLYLTSMYSLKDGQNVEVYDVIRTVVMQEMLHMAQAANILIALGGRPIIDKKDRVPNYPGKLPAGILPGLNVTLQKASPRHIYEVFMMIEYPHGEKDIGLDAKNQLTIGKFYQQIKQCIKKLTENDDIFCNTKECLKKQLYWPWKQQQATNVLIQVKDAKSSKKAIKMIVEQGEGAGKQDPTYLDTKWLAHFYKFEELACKQHLLLKHKHKQELVGFGDELEFTADGVWPMRVNPSKNGIPPNTQVYYKAKLFHQVYRSLLAKIQEMFDGKPDGIDDAVYLMESLQLHAKDLMRLEVPSPPGWPKHTCGPVFDYEWDD